MTRMPNDQPAVLYRGQVTEVEYVTDAIVPDPLVVEALQPVVGDPAVRVGDRVLDYWEAMALASVITEAAGSIAVEATRSRRWFGRALQPGQLSAPTPAQLLLVQRRAQGAARLVGLVTEAIRAGDE